MLIITGLGGVLLWGRDYVHTWSCIGVYLELHSYALTSISLVHIPLHELTSTSRLEYGQNKERIPGDSYVVPFWL